MLKNCNLTCRTNAFSEHAHRLKGFLQKSNEALKNKVANAKPSRCLEERQKGVNDTVAQLALHSGDAKIAEETNCFLSYRVPVL